MLTGSNLPGSHCCRACEHESNAHPGQLADLSKAVHNRRLDIGDDGVVHGEKENGGQDCRENQNPLVVACIR